jgi:hypothetical protein
MQDLNRTLGLLPSGERCLELFGKFAKTWQIHSKYLFIKAFFNIKGRVPGQKRHRIRPRRSTRHVRGFVASRQQAPLSVSDSALANTAPRRPYSKLFRQLGPKRSVPPWSFDCFRERRNKRYAHGNS